MLKVHFISTYRWQGIPWGWCSLNIKDLLRAVDGLMMLIMDGGYYGRWRVGNRLRVPLPGRWGWCQPRPDSARVLKGRMQLVKAIAAVKGRSNKSLKVKWHTIWRGWWPCKRSPRAFSFICARVTLNASLTDRFPFETYFMKNPTKLST